MKRNTKLLRAFFGLVGLLIVGNAVLALWNLQRIQEHQRLVSHTLEVRGLLYQIMSLLNESETGQRGYILTGERAYIEPYLSASSRVHERIDSFRELTRDNPQQQANIDRLEQLIDLRLATMQQRLDDFDTFGYVIGAESLRQGGGRLQMESVRVFVAEMDRLESELFAARQAQARASYQLAVLSSGVGSLIGIGLVGLGFIRLQRELAYRRQSTRVLGEQREWFRTVLASVGDAVIATGTDGRVTFLNAVAEELTGWKHDEAIGLQLDRVFHIVNEETRESVENPAVLALREGRIVGLGNHTVLISKDGSTERSIDDSAAPILLEDGTPVGAVLIFRDVTEKRLADLERSVAFDREQEARRRAEEANRLKDDFLATISHELRTPLNAILGWSAILRSDNATPDMFGRGIDTIDRNARTQAQLIEDLLDASRITRGVLRLDVSTVDPARVIRSAIEAVQLAADAREVEIVLSLETNVGQLLGDAQRVQQIVWNLLSNAIKFSPKGGRVEVAVKRIEEVIEIAVTDSGRGIDAKFLPYVFERFRQADGSSSRAHGGIGLGLAIVKQLTELHGGTIEASSEGEGKGATFVVRLPIAPLIRANNGVLEESLSVAPGSYDEFVPVPLDGLRVAIVDDEPETLVLLEQILVRCDAEVRSASSSAEGLELVRSWKPDLLVSDIGMPDGDGYELIKGVRALTREQGGAVPAIALTGYSRVEDRVRVLASGFQMHVTKPVEPEEFIAVITSVVGFERQQSGL